jgi:hypothetical protein
MKQLTIRNRLFLLVGFIGSCMLFVQCPKTCNHSNLSPTQPQKSIKQKKPKDLLRVRQWPSNNAHYVEITIQPSNTGTELSQCTLTATNLTGRGRLLAAVDKVQGRLQYKIPLEQETNLDKIYLSKGNAVVFKQGKSIGIRCVYEPDVGTQQREDHQLQIKVCVYDGSRQILEQQAEKVSFLITQGPKPKKPKITKPNKKRPSRTPKKSSQPKEIGKVIPPDNRFTQPE